MNNCGSPFIHPVDNEGGGLFKQQAGQDIGDWHSLGENFAEMLVFIVGIQFYVVEDLRQLRFAYPQELARSQSAAEHLLGKTDQIYLILCENSFLERAQFDQRDGSFVLASQQSVEKRYQIDLHNFVVFQSSLEIAFVELVRSDSIDDPLFVEAGDTAPAISHHFTYF
jgi:hypothetical protein